MYRQSLAVAAAAVILGAGTGWAQNFAAPLDAHLSVEWEVGPAREGRATLSGYVHSSRGWHAQNARLQVEALDAAGEVVGKTVVYVNGQIPPFGRAYFTARVLAGATYRLTLLSVDWRSRPSSFQLILPRMGPAEGR